MTTINGTIITEGAIVVTIDCKPYSVATDNPNYDEIINAIRDKDGDKVIELINFNSRVMSDSGLFAEYFKKLDVEDEFEIDEYTIKYKGEPIDDFLVKKLKEFYAIGIEDTITHYINFIKNLYQNPSFQSINELFLFLDRHGLPITEDGHFLAYKTVGSDYLDKYSGTVLNSVGSVIEMPRYKVDDNRNKTCSYGYHVGSWEYAGKGGWYNASEDIVLLCKVNPRDAVSVPSDHSDQKLRVCRYEVIDEYKDETYIDSSVYNTNVPEECAIDDECRHISQEEEDTVDYITVADSHGRVFQVEVGDELSIEYTKPGEGTKRRYFKVTGFTKSTSGMLINIKAELTKLDPNYTYGESNIRIFSVTRITPNSYVAGAKNSQSDTIGNFKFKDRFGNNVELVIGNTYTFINEGVFRIITITGFSDSDGRFDGDSSDNDLGITGYGYSFSIHNTSHFEEVE